MSLSSLTTAPSLTQFNFGSISSQGSLSGLPRDPSQQPPLFGTTPMHTNFQSFPYANSGLGGGGFPMALMVMMPLLMSVIPLLQSIFSGLGRNNKGDSDQYTSNNRNSANRNNNIKGCNCAKQSSPLNLSISDNMSSGDFT